MNKQPAAPIDFSDPQQVAAKRSEVERIEQRRVNDFKVVMSMKEGRRFIWATMTDCNVFGEAFTGVASTTDYNLGKRSQGLKLLRDVMKHCSDLYLQMVEENKEDL